VTPEVLKAAQDNLVAIAASVTALATIIAAAIKGRAYLTRSRLLIPNAFPLPEIPGDQVIFDDTQPEETMLFGRKKETRDVVRAIQERSLTFLYGESGSGKSSLLKLGVARELKQSGRWIPIYVDTWGQDWAQGPQASLADATEFALRALGLSDGEAVSSANIFSRLSKLRSVTGRRPVLLFDQLDDYQNAHRAHFRNSDTGRLVSTDELCAANPFWQSIRQLLVNPDEPVRILLTTREDAKAGLHCFQFVDPGVYPLGRLYSEEARQLIHRLAPEAVVNKPENGFRQVVEKIVVELGRDHEASLLPMQLRVALAGMGNLSGSLTPSRVERLGGVPGLGAFYIERSIRGIQGAWPLLNAMVQRTEAGAAKAILLRDEDVAGLVLGLDKSVLLQRLIDTRIIRLRLDSSESRTWQLYHDYLADAIVALDRRNRKWLLLVREAADRHLSSLSLLQWWTRLLGPWTQLRIYWHRLFDRNFRLGEYQAFLRLSSLRLIFNLWLLTALSGAGGWIWWNEQRTAAHAADAFFQNADTKQELQALWRLAILHSARTSKDFFKLLLSTPVGRARLEANIGPAITTMGLSSQSLDMLRGLSANEACFTIPMACASISTAAGDALVFADRILARMQQTTDPVELSRLGDALAALAKETHGSQAAQGADRILARMQQPTRPLELSSLGNALAAMVKETHGPQAAQGADRILARMQETTEPNELSSLGNALAPLAEETHGPQAAQLADRILARMQETTEPNELSSLGSSLAALSKETHDPQAARLADRVLARMQQTNEPVELGSLGNALATLTKETHSPQAAQGADRILMRMQQTSSPQATRGADRMLGLMQQSTESVQLASLGNTLAALAKEIHAPQAAQLADRILTRMHQSTNSVELSSLGNALAVLAKETHGPQGAQLADRILVWMSHAANPIDLFSLGNTLAELSKESHGRQAVQLADRILMRMQQTTNSVELGSLGNALATLAKETQGPQAVLGTDRILAQMQRTTNPYESSNFGNALVALALGNALAALAACGASLHFR
jgi:hypothetical protein